MIQPPSVQLITISREFGAGGSELASALRVRLGWPVLDRDLVHRVAERLRLDDGTVEHLDEHPPSLLARIASVLIVPADLYSVPIPTDLPNPDAIADASRAVIEEMSAAPPLIIVGHGAQCILAHRPDVLHVRVVAPVKLRLARVMRRLEIDAARATALLRRADHDRQAYVQRYFHRDLRDDLLYDLRINTGRLSIDESAGLVAGLVTRRGPTAVQTPELSAPVP